MDAAKEAYMAIPPVSRYYISLVFLQSFAATYRIINPYYLILDFDKVFGSFQVPSQPINMICYSTQHGLLI